MITAVDSNVLFDVLSADVVHGAASRSALSRSLHEGALIASDCVWAELAAAFPSADVLASTMARLGVSCVAMDETAAVAAGRAWRSYRDAGGRRGRILTDFLVAAHALVHADRLLTRDRGIYRTHFADLVVLDPSAS